MGLPAVAALAALLLGSSDPVLRGVGEPDPRTPRRVTVHVVPAPAVVQPGETFDVHAEVTPAPGIKVYAPGDRTYTPVTWTMKWPDTVRATRPAYPPSETHVFGALKEIVQVYSRPFRITQKVTLPRAAPRGSTMEVAGLLRYQSCDDRTCFPVESLPVRVSITVAPGARAPSAAR